MPYKIKNGSVWVLFDGAWWIDSVLYMCFPDLKSQGLKPLA